MPQYCAHCGIDKGHVTGSAKCPKNAAPQRRIAAASTRGAIRGGATQAGVGPTPAGGTGVSKMLAAVHAARLKKAQDAAAQLQEQRRGQAGAAAVSGRERATPSAISLQMAAAATKNRKLLEVLGATRALPDGYMYLFTVNSTAWAEGSFLRVPAGPVYGVGILSSMDGSAQAAMTGDGAATAPLPSNLTGIRSSNYKTCRGFAAKVGADSHCMIALSHANSHERMIAQLRGFFSLLKERGLDKSAIQIAFLGNYNRASNETTGPFKTEFDALNAIVRANSGTPAPLWLTPPVFTEICVDVTSSGVEIRATALIISRRPAGAGLIRRQVQWNQTYSWGESLQTWARKEVGSA